MKKVQMVHSSKKSAKSLAPLEQMGWLSQCSKPLQSWFANNGRWMRVTQGASLFHEADAADGMYGVGTGAVDIEFAPEGLDGLAVVRVPPGGWLGQGCLLPDMPRPFNLIAAIDSNIYFVARNDLRLFLAKNPDFWPEFYELSLMQVLGVMTYLCETHTLTPEARLSRQLLRLSADNSEIDIRQTDLVALLGMSRSNVRRALKILVEAEIIATGYSSILVLNRKRLETVSSQTR